MWHLMLLGVFSLSTLVPLNPLGTTAAGVWIWLQPAALFTAVGLTLVGVLLALRHHLRPSGLWVKACQTIAVTQGILLVIFLGPHYFGIMVMVCAAAVVGIGTWLAHASHRDVRTSATMNSR